MSFVNYKVKLWEHGRYCGYEPYEDLDEIESDILNCRTVYETKRTTLECIREDARGMPLATFKVKCTPGWEIRLHNKLILMAIKNL